MADLDEPVFLSACRRVAERHRAILVDGPGLLTGLDPRGLLGDAALHDAQHPNLAAECVLARAVLEVRALDRKWSMGWPDGVRDPVITPAECAEHFGMTPERWAEVCERSASFYDRVAYIHHDPAPLLERGAAYHAAAEAIRSGRSPDEVGLPGVGVSPAARTAGAPPSPGRPR